MRGREFVMKDAYSFDRDVEGALKSYDKMFNAYQRIFTRLGLNFRAVNADTGSIGGTRSHEFHVIADTGEDAIAYCPASEYAANVELAEAVCSDVRGAATLPLSKVATPNASKCEDVAAILGLPLTSTVKSVVYALDVVDDIAKPTGQVQLVLVLVRGDHEVNEIKVAKLRGLKELRLATEAEIEAAFACKPGYLGPVGLEVGAGSSKAAAVLIVADKTVAAMANFVTGANAVGYHYMGVNWGRDLPEPEVADVRNVVEGDASPDGKGQLQICRGIEVGHVFYLGTTYSYALNATFLDETGKPKVMEMGCYGIGVTRILGAAIEQNYDERGMKWPVSIAPFELVLCPIGYKKSVEVKAATDALYQELSRLGLDVILDDRDERPGAMFADWELIGVPFRVTIGDRGLKNGQLEWQARGDAASHELALAGAGAWVAEQVRLAKEGLSPSLAQ
jgi:prolyl-tRNA synthetase